MADCPFKLEKTKSYEKGKETKVYIDPPIAYPCSAEFQINGKQAEPGDNGDLHISSITASGEIYLTPKTDDPGGTITVTVRCTGAVPCGPTKRAFPVAEIGFEPVEIPANPPLGKSHIVDEFSDPRSLPPEERPKGYQPHISKEAEDHNRAVGVREDEERKHAGEPKGREEKGRIVVPIPVYPNPLGSDDKPKKKDD